MRLGAPSTAENMYFRAPALRELGAGADADKTVERLAAQRASVSLPPCGGHE